MELVRNIVVGDHSWIINFTHVLIWAFGFISGVVWIAVRESVMDD